MTKLIQAGSLPWRSCDVGWCMAVVLQPNATMQEGPLNISSAPSTSPSSSPSTSPQGHLPSPPPTWPEDHQLSPRPTLPQVKIWPNGDLQFGYGDPQFLFCSNLKLILHVSAMSHPHSN